MFNGTQEVFDEITARAFKDMMGYAMSLESTFEGRTFFTTRCGGLDIGPIGLDGSNPIFAVQGCRYALVLRAGDRGRYLLEGCVYVRGIMKGEAPRTGQLQDIEI